MGTKRLLTDDIQHIGFSKEWALRYDWDYLDCPIHGWNWRKNWSRIRKIKHRNKKRRRK